MKQDTYCTGELPRTTQLKNKRYCQPGYDALTVKEKEALQHFQLMSTNSKISLTEFRKWQRLQKEVPIGIAAYLKVKNNFLPQAARCYVITDCFDEFELDEFEFEASSTLKPKLDNVTPKIETTVESIDDQNVTVERKVTTNSTEAQEEVQEEKIKTTTEKPTTESMQEETEGITMQKITTTTTTSVTTRGSTTPAVSTTPKPVMLTTTHVVTFPGRFCYLWWTQFFVVCTCDSPSAKTKKVDSLISSFSWILYQILLQTFLSKGQFSPLKNWLITLVCT